jgi:ribonuclease HI
MSIPRPHFLLFCDGSLPSTQNLSTTISQHRGRWRFVLESLDNSRRLEAADAETADTPDRIALFAVVRGLEALEQPSHVTLVTSSRYVSRGLQYGLNEWRENEYCWEHFGTLQPIRNQDLWQRIDHALQYHEVTCRLMAGEQGTSVHVEQAIETAAPQELVTSVPAFADSIVHQEVAYAMQTISQSQQSGASSAIDLAAAEEQTAESAAGIELQSVAVNRWRRVDMAHSTFSPARKSNYSPKTKFRPNHAAAMSAHLSELWARLRFAIQILFGRKGLLSHGHIVS